MIKGFFLVKYFISYEVILDNNFEFIPRERDDFVYLQIGSCSEMTFQACIFLWKLMDTEEDQSSEKLSDVLSKQSVR